MFLQRADTDLNLAAAFQERPSTVTTVPAANLLPALLDLC